MYSYYCQVTSALIDISYNCNAKCPFCLRQHLQTPLSGVMTPDIFDKVLYELRKTPSIRTIVLAAAGEPLMNPYFGEYVSALKKWGYKIHCITNMALAHKFMDDLLKCDNLLLSIEGWDQESYEFYRKGLSFASVKHNMERLDHEIKLLESKGVQRPIREVNLLLTRKTNVNLFVNCWSHLVDSIRIDVLLPLKHWNEKRQLFERIYVEELKDHYFEFIEGQKKLTCMQPFDRISIRANGEMALCCTDFKEISLGRFTGLTSYYFDEQLVKVRREFLQGRTPDICQLCHLNLQVDRQAIFSLMPELNQYIDDKRIKIAF
ncbi:radical SAM/SPASM domain-containing protein [Pelosinus sp. sgz500959]|uniref:radical SAM protein n=1 Tax=Pelosinus sp. sgz500959 TaxID=3242472 RepID=UPI00366CE88D